MTREELKNKIVEQYKVTINKENYIKIYYNGIMMEINFGNKINIYVEEFPNKNNNYLCNRYYKTTDNAYVAIIRLLENE